MPGLTIGENEEMPKIMSKKVTKRICCKQDDSDNVFEIKLSS